MLRYEEMAVRRLICLLYDSGLSASDSGLVGCVSGYRAFSGLFIRRRRRVTTHCSTDGTRRTATDGSRHCRRHGVVSRSIGVSSPAGAILRQPKRKEPTKLWHLGPTGGRVVCGLTVAASDSRCHGWTPTEKISTVGDCVASAQCDVL